MTTTTTAKSVHFIPVVTGDGATDGFIDWAMNQEDAPCRKWAYEVEHNAIGQVAYVLEDLGLDTCEDGSISVDCTCDCDDCSHACDCQHCERADYDYHCGPCQHAEAKPATPCQTTHDGDRLVGLSEALDGLYFDDEQCGGHIHVNASDMTVAQVAQVAMAWHNIQDKFSHLIGRGYGHYCAAYADTEIRAMQAGQYYGDKYRAVNVSHILGAMQEAQQGYTRRLEREYKTTIEFRQFAGSSDYRLIIARGYLVRALVEYFKAGQSYYWLNRCQTVAEIRQILGLY